MRTRARESQGSRAPPDSQGRRNDIIIILLLLLLLILSLVLSLSLSIRIIIINNKICVLEGVGEGGMNEGKLPPKTLFFLGNLVTIKFGFF